MKRTVIVIGAGAGKDFGMPTGEELVRQIADQAEVAQTFHYEIREYYKIRGKIHGEGLEKSLLEEQFKKGKYKPYSDISKIVSYYQPFSIDELLDSIRQDKINISIEDAETTKEKLIEAGSIEDAETAKEKLIEAGKTLIAMFLLQAEDKKIFGNFEATCWYRHLRSAIITSGKNDDEIAKQLKNMTIISFNYDRSLDYFLRTRLGKFYDKIKVIYPYGKLAGDWNEKSQDYSDISYGYFKKIGEADAKKRKEIFEAAEAIGKKGGKERLKIIGELDDSCELKEIQKSITEAGNIYFLGFGFHQENCRILGVTTETKLTVRVEMPNEKGEASAEPELRSVFYTNFGNSKKIKQKFEQFTNYNFTNCNPENFSDKGVYEALKSDFNLEL